MLFHFLNLYVEKKTVEKAVACTMIFNTASMMTNLFLNHQNRLFLCSGIGLFIVLIFHAIKLNFVKTETCAIILNSASPADKFMKQRKINKKCIFCWSCTPFILFTYKDVLRNPRSVG